MHAAVAHSASVLTRHRQSFNRRRNGYTSLFHQGVFIPRESHETRQITGSSWVLQFEIVDKRPTVAGIENYQDIVVTFGTMVLHKERYTKEGRYSVVLETPAHQACGQVRIEMRNRFQQYFSDTLPVSFNANYDRALKVCVRLEMVAALIVTY